MSGRNAGIAERMQGAFAINVSDAAASRHQANISEAIRSVDVVAPSRIPRWRMRVPALVAATVVVLPIGAALAAESATPGDVLYPVKRIVEPAVAIFNEDIIAAHRVDELARIVGDPVEFDRIPAAVSDARDAVSTLPPGHELRTEFRAIADRVGRRNAQDRPTTDVPQDEDRSPVDGQSRPAEPYVPPAPDPTEDGRRGDGDVPHTSVPDTTVPGTTDTTVVRHDVPPATSDTRPPPVDEAPRDEPSPVRDHDGSFGDTTTDGTTRPRTDR
ncbi:MAG: hypothetical protein M3132_00165 [Actinomycetia bacterium]|nr:hypothetical protein [Actinomycetes bacterium]